MTQGNDMYPAIVTASLIMELLRLVAEARGRDDAESIATQVWSEFSTQTITPDANSAMLARLNDLCAPAVDRARVERAIEIVSFSRSTHVEWLAWQEETPDWRTQVEPESPGDEDHHRTAISDYDEVLGTLADVLKALAP